MTRHRRFPTGKSLYFLAILGLLTSFFTERSLAQIQPDTTLENESSNVLPSEINNTSSELIAGGARRGENLFHSFESFSVGAGKSVYFDNPNGVSRIFSRVTGNSPSEILGVLGVWNHQIGQRGGADLFFINPNGIVLGRDARLDLGGSFTASTASGILFSDAREFNTKNTTDASLLSVTIPIGLQFRENPGSIVVRASSSIDPFTGFPDPLSGLTIGGGRTLALIGGNVTLDREAVVGSGAFDEVGGRIEIGAVGANESVALEAIPEGWAVNYNPTRTFADISLLSLALIKSGSNIATGEIQLQGRNISFVEGAQISSFNNSDRPGGRIAIRASETLSISGSAIVSGSFLLPSSVANLAGASGQAGEISISARNVRLSDNAGISTQALPGSSGQSGTIAISASESIELTDRGIITANTFGQGDAGAIAITTGVLKILSGSEISSATGGDGKGGNIAIDARTIELAGFSPLIGKSSAIETLSVGSETATGGNISIVADTLQIANGATLNAATFSAAGGGDIAIDTRILSVLDGGQILSSTFSSGTAGNIILDAADSIVLAGQDETFLARSREFREGIARATGPGSGIFASTAPDTDGDGGSILARSPRIILENNAEISVGSQGTGNAGNLLLRADTLTLDRGSRVSASSRSGRGGDLTLQISNRLGVSNSEISASTETGIGGDLTIGAGRVDLSNRGVISVSGPEGQAGDLRIDANSLFLSRGAITAETGKSGTEGANIALNIRDSFRMGDESLISATATGFANGGNIAIRTPFLVVFPATGDNGSDILAKADGGDGGNIFIEANGIFGIEENPAIAGNGSNDIDASSRLGAPGRVELRAALDPNQGTVQLPETVIDPSALVARNSCRRGTESQFTITGKGGLPASVSDDLGEMAIDVPLLEPAPTTAVKPAGEIKNASFSPIVPARGWIANERGKILLVSYDPAVTGAGRSPRSAPTCPAP